MVLLCEDEHISLHSISEMRKAAGHGQRDQLLHLHLQIGVRAFSDLQDIIALKIPVFPVSMVIQYLLLTSTEVCMNVGHF